MKRRYTILFFIALSPLIGLSWLASKLGTSIWSVFNFHLIAMMVAAGVSAYAAQFTIDKKWPAYVALVCSLPMSWQMFRLLGSMDELLEYIGPSAVPLVLGSLATTVAAFVFTRLPMPPAPREPQVAPARVVD